MADNPFVSVIIPVRNFERTISKTFEYLMKVKYPRDRLEVIIADGGSTDKTLEIIKAWQAKHGFIKLVEISACPSPAFARNKALEVVRGEFIFFTDGDCAPCEDWINIILKHFAKDPRIGIVGGEIYTLRADKDNLTEAFCEHFKFNMVSPRYGWIKEGYFPPSVSGSAPTQVAGHKAYFFVTANVAYRKKAIDDTGARFWGYPTGEDVDMCLQVQSKGWRLYFAPDAKVDHMHRSTLPALRKVWVTYGMAHPPLLKRHASNYMEIVLQTIGRYPHNPVISIPFPIKGFIYLGNFQLMHLSALLFIISLISLVFNPYLSWLNIAVVLMFTLTLYFVFGFYKWCLYMEPHNRFFTWCKMKYLTNLSFIIGGLKGSIRYKTFCIEPSF